MLNLETDKNKFLINVKNVSLIIVFIISIFIFSGCYYDSQEYMFPELGSGCDTTNVTFSGTLEPMLSSYCLSCHSNSTAASYGANIKLENYSDVLLRVNDGKLYGSIAQSGGFSPMPKNSTKLSDCKISSVKIWIDAGAPNN